jgi:Protein of unknown function (DUF3347)
MRQTMMIALVSVLSFGAYAQHDHAGHDAQKIDEATVKFKDDKLQIAYTHYIHLKDALVGSNANEAKLAAGDLQKSLLGINGGKKAADEAAKLAETKDLDDQRKAFSTLSNEITSLVKNGKLASGALYLEYCPMANNNEGGFWLSNEKQIKNPYFGHAMLRCGSVKETIQ